MKQIIAFDGCDCIGKSTIIDKLVRNLNDSNINTFVFHLTGPGDEQNFISEFNNIGNISKVAIQYLKFYELFKTIEVIISSSTNNIVILDRTPYSEYIWAKFFNRDNAESAYLFNEHMFKTFENINRNMLYVSLNVDAEILTDRILRNEEDRINFLNAFNIFYRQTNLSSTFTEDIDTCKVLFMVQWVKNNYADLTLDLRKQNISVIELKNNCEFDMDSIVSDIIVNL